MYTEMRPERYAVTHKAKNEQNFPANAQFRLEHRSVKHRLYGPEVFEHLQLATKGYNFI